MQDHILWSPCTSWLLAILAMQLLLCHPPGMTIVISHYRVTHRQGQQAEEQSLREGGENSPSSLAQSAATALADA